MESQNTSDDDAFESKADYIQEKVVLNRKEVYEKTLLGLFFTALSIR